MRIKSLLSTLIQILFGLTLLASAQEPAPVAVVSATNGEISVRRVGSTEEVPAYRLTFLNADDTLHSHGGDVTVTYFRDGRKWELKGDALAKVGLNALDTGGVFPGAVNSISAHRRSTPYQVPTALLTPPSEPDISQPEEGLASENVHLSAYVDLGVYPPAFHWAPNKLSGYRLSLFNESREFIHEFKLKTEDFDYPAHARAPLRLTKGATYYWQVKDVDGNLLVNMYAFSPLTRIQIKELNLYQRRLGEKDPSSYVDLLLVEVQNGAVDKYLHLLERMAVLEPANPEIQRALACAYTTRGAPAHARQALRRARELEGNSGE